MLKLKEPLPSLVTYFSDPDYTDPDQTWCSHFLNSANIVFNHIKADYELLGVVGTFLTPFVSYKHKKYKEERKEILRK